MPPPLYGKRSSPTARQIADAIVLNNGNCCRALYYCAGSSTSYTSDRGGDNCPLYRPAMFCKLDDRTRVLALRKLLMGDLI